MLRTVVLRCAACSGVSRLSTILSYQNTIVLIYYDASELIRRSSIIDSLWPFASHEVRLYQIVQPCLNLGGPHVLSAAPLAQGPGYYLDLANINYYAAGGEPPPTWYGTAAKELGLSGLAQREHVERLCAGFHHETNKSLVRNAGKDTRNPGHDLTFSAPKSVSVLWAMADPALRKAIEIKHEQAVKAALDFIEQRAGFARVGKDGETLVKAPLLFCLFEHGTSRAKDPQLHTHALCVNLTVHEDGRTTAIDSTHLYHWKMAGGAVYRAVFAPLIQELGFEVVQRRIGSSIGFEIKGVPQPLIEEFSKRKAEMDELITLRAGSLDAASAKYAALIALETRRTKDTEVPRAELLREWQAVGREFGFDLEAFYDLRVPVERLTPEQVAERKEVIFQDAVKTLSEQLSHWNEAELTKAVVERAVGLIAADEALGLVKEKLGSDELVAIGTLVTDAKGGTRYIDRTEMRYTTPEILRLEEAMLQDVERIVQGPDSSVSSERVERALRETPRTLDPEQKEVVRWLTSGPGVRLLSGVAGSGKTWTLETCREIWESEGREVIGATVAAKTAKRLERGTGIKSGTLDGLLNRLDRGEVSLDGRSVVVVDEAGMVGTKHMARLSKYLADAEGSRLVLAGDRVQIQPIMAGGPFRYMGDALKEAELTTVRRQNEPWQRQAVTDFRAGNSQEAIDAFRQRGLVHIAKTRTQAMAELVEQWKADGGIFKPDSVLMLASLNCEVKQLNVLAQAERIRAGEVDGEKKIHANGVNFHPGDRLQFLLNSKPLGVSNGDGGTVVDVDPDRKKIRVRLEDDDREIDVAFNRYQPEKLRLGYASTTFKAQGATLDHVHVLLGGMFTDRHMTYVQASRSVFSTHLFCDKDTAGKELADLVRAAARERPKTMAHAIVDRPAGQVEHSISDDPRHGVKREQSQDQGHRHDHGPSLSL